MSHHTISSAYASFGASVPHGARSLSAVAADGAVVLTCEYPYFVRSQPGVLRYHDTLARSAENGRASRELGVHLALARDGERAVRLVVVSPARNAQTQRRVHVRSDLIGRVTEFDGDSFVVDFTRPMAAATPKKGSGRARA